MPNLRVCIKAAATYHALEAARFIHGHFSRKYEQQVRMFNNDGKASLPVATPLPSVENIVKAQERNEYSLVITRRDNKTVGVVELWAIKEMQLRFLLSGALTESDLTEDHFMTYTRHIKSLYIAITAPQFSTDPTTASTSVLRGCLAGAFTVLQQAYFANSGKRHAMKLFGLETSDQGRQMMAAIGFKRADALSEQRPNGIGVWSYDLTHDSLRRLQGRYSQRRPEHG